jgi:hypothetical protein
MFGTSPRVNGTAAVQERLREPLRLVYIVLRADT